jgi:SAM-dependent methyltransferase
MNLTEIEFWDNYWRNVKLPSVPDKSHSFDRCLSRELERITRNKKGEILEIGCAPGKWISHLALCNGLTPSGIEYSPIGLELTYKNFELLKIKPGTIFVGDFFELEPTREFDIVMSLGLIEHFDDAEKVIYKHIEWLKDDGLLILGIPNFSGVTKFIQHYFDKSLLDKHNLQIMNVEFFRNIGKKFNLKEIEINYIGSFEPDLPIPKTRFGNPIQITLKIILIIMRKLRRFSFTDKLNHSSYSSYILAVFQK